MEKQTEMKGLPKRTPLGKMAIKFLAQKDEIDDLLVGVEKTKRELIALFKKEGKEVVNINGRIVAYSHTAKDNISIRKE